VKLLKHIGEHGTEIDWSAVHLCWGDERYVTEDDENPRYAAWSKRCAAAPGFEVPDPSPVPLFADGAGLPWGVAVDDAILAIADARQRLGDTFAVRSVGDDYLFTFSPTGVESFYTDFTGGRKSNSAKPSTGSRLRRSRPCRPGRRSVRRLPDQPGVGEQHQRAS
jgi:hypothetical protein